MAEKRIGHKGANEIVWEREGPPHRPAPMPLDKEKILSVALRLADENGLAAVSLRNVAGALEVGPMRLYGYIATKEELHDLMIDAVYDGITLPETSKKNWRGELRSVANGLRMATRRHEWFSDLLGGRPHIGPNALAFLEASLSALTDAPGFENIDVVMQAVFIVKAYVIGAIQNEFAELRAERATGKNKEEWQMATGPYLQRLLATGQYPSLTKVYEDATHPNADAVFEKGLEWVLDGIAARIGK